MIALTCRKTDLVVKAVGGGALNGTGDVFQIGLARDMIVEKESGRDPPWTSRCRNGRHNLPA